MTGDMPVFASSVYASSAYAGDFQGGIAHGSDLGQLNNFPMAQSSDDKLVQAIRENQVKQRAIRPILQVKMEQAEMTIRRVVKVFVADPNENVPVENCLLYSGSEKLTDATDQELFFELDIKTLLDNHNAMRTKIVDKKVKDRTEYLEPIKIRELRMVVVTVASF